MGTFEEDTLKWPWLMRVYQASALKLRQRSGRSGAGNFNRLLHLPVPVSYVQDHCIPQTWIQEEMKAQHHPELWLTTAPFSRCAHRVSHWHCSPGILQVCKPIASSHQAPNVDSKKGCLHDGSCLNTSIVPIDGNRSCRGRLVLGTLHLTARLTTESSLHLKPAAQRRSFPTRQARFRTSVRYSI